MVRTPKRLFWTPKGLSQTPQQITSSNSSVIYSDTPLVQFVVQRFWPRDQTPRRSTTTLGRNIDRTERNTEPTEPKKWKIRVSVFRHFFGLQASYRAETLTQDRSRAPRHGKKIEKSAKLPNRPNRSTRSTDRATDRTDRRPPCILCSNTLHICDHQARRSDQIHLCDRSSIAPGTIN